MFTCYVNKSSLLKELEKEKEKEKKFRSDMWEYYENVDVKTKEKWFGKQNRKEDEVCGKENENKGEQRRWWKQRWKW